MKDPETMKKESRQKIDQEARIRFKGRPKIDRDEEIEWFKKIVFPWMKECWWLGWGMFIGTAIMFISGSN